MSALDVEDALSHLNLTDNSKTRAEVQPFIDAAEAAIGRLCGPLSPTVVTARVFGNGSSLVLPTTPVLSPLTSVTPANGTALTLGDLYLNTAAGVVSYSSGAPLSARYYDVVYNAGRADGQCPPDLLMAVKELVRHLYQTQRGPTRRPGSQPSDGASNTIPGAAYLLPFRVTELMAPHMLVTGFA